jgi:hypothetical protein
MLPPRLRAAHAIRSTERRQFITLLGGAAAWPLAARAQQLDRVQRVSVLMGPAENDPEAQSEIAAFRQGLQKLGWTGRNVRIAYRWAAGDPDRMRTFAKELVALQQGFIAPALSAEALAQTSVPNEAQRRTGKKRDLSTVRKPRLAYLALYVSFRQQRT